MSCRVLQVSPQAYYKWVRKPVSAREYGDSVLLVKIREAHREYPGYGYRLITHHLQETGTMVSENRVHKICKKYSIYAHFVKKKPRPAKSLPPSCVDLVRRDFTAKKPNQKWVIDITEHPTREGTLYLCAIQDLYSNKIVGYSMSDNRCVDIATNALAMAITTRQPTKGLIIHSDRGGQFRAKAYIEIINEHGLYQSMGNKGSSADNAAIESFFSLLQKNILNLRQWNTKAELRSAIFQWVNIEYNNKRPQQKLDRQTPNQYEKINQAATAA